MTFLSKFFHHWLVLLKDRAYRISLFVGLLVTEAAYLINNFISVYKDEKVLASVGDLILDRIPTYNMEFFYTWVMLGLSVFLFFYIIFYKPEIFPFTLKTFGLLIIVRSLFISLTSIGPPDGFYYENALIGGYRFTDFMFRNDLFFSGHTAFPFLGFLLLKDSRMKWIFLFGSLLMGLTVLLMHIHYSIDVFAAFFITYGTYRVSDRVFNGLNLRFAKRLSVYKEMIDPLIYKKISFKKKR